MLQTNLRISRAGNTVWKQAKRQTDRALDQPKKLLALLNGGGKGGPGEGSDEDVEGASLETYRCAPDQAHTMDCVQHSTAFHPFLLFSALLQCGEDLARRHAVGLDWLAASCLDKH